jgi:hypothetical protein
VAAAKNVRGEYGKALSKEEKARVLKSIGDVYKDQKLDKVVAGVDHNEDPIYRYPHSPEQQPFDAQFKGLAIEDQFDVWRVSSDGEKARELPLIVQKLKNMRDKSPEQPAAIKRRYADVLADLRSRLHRAA